MKRFDYDDERFVDDCEENDNFHEIQEQNMTRCKKCSIDFDSVGDLERHEVVNHPELFSTFEPEVKDNINFEPEWKCPDCGKLFFYELTMDLHREKFHNIPLK